MRLVQIAQFLGGSFAVYFLSVACGAPAEHAAGDLGGSTSSGAVSSSTGGNSSGMAMLSDPTSDAMAADPVNPTGEVVTAGTRIKPRYLTQTFTDGAKRVQFTGWYDADRSEPCDIKQTDVSEFRCVPAAITGGTYFSDATCTTPAAVAPATDAKYMTGSGGLYALGASSAGTKYVSTTGTNCVSLGAANMQSATGTIIPYSAFVSVTSTTM
jgi:hypothetical protein